MNTTPTDEQYALVIDYTDDYDVPSVHGPFSTLPEAETYATRYRTLGGIPEDADEREALGWRFMILPLRWELT